MSQQNSKKSFCLYKFSNRHVSVWFLLTLQNCKANVCIFVKSVRIWSFSGPYFPAFGLNTDQKNSEYGQFLLSGMFLLWCLYLQFCSPDLDLPFFNPSFISLFPCNSSNFLLFSWFDYFVSIICKIICAILD